MKYCTNCGTPNPDDSRFCRECGLPMEGTGGQKSAPPKKKKTGKWALAVSGGILLAAVSISAVSVAMKTGEVNENKQISERLEAEDRKKEETAEIIWEKNEFCSLGDFKSMVQQKLAYSGELVVCESQISDILFRYPKEWRDRLYFQENENGLSIFSQDMMNCAEKMNGEPGYWRHCSFLLAKVFYNFHDVDICWQALQNSQDPLYLEDMFFGLGAEKEDLHLLKDKDGNSFVIYVDDREDRPDKWAEFEGYDTECEEYGQNMREILLNWEIVLAGFSKKV